MSQGDAARWLRGKGTAVTIGLFACALACWFLQQWIAGLPGHKHAAYLTYASLGNINQGLRMYEGAHGSLPHATASDAQSGHQSSWRIEVYENMAWPDVEGKAYQPIGYDRHKPWNDPTNLRLQGPGTLFFAYTQHDLSNGNGDANYLTCYKAITGADTAFDGGEPRVRANLPASLIIVVRVEHSKTHWMEPGDLRVEQLDPSDTTKRLLCGQVGYAVLFADGNPWILSRRVPLSDLCRFFTITGASRADRDEILGPYRILP